MNQKNQSYYVDIAIIGAGASGLYCAATCSHQNNSVLVLEHNKESGKKILISGGGRCNFTNQKVSPNDYVSNGRHFHKYALNQYAPDNFIKKVKAHKIDFYEKKLGQLFCKKSAKDIVEMLLKECHQNGAKMLYNQKDLHIDHDGVHFVIENEKITVTAKNLVIATGGLSIKTIGATDFGHRIAKKFGHKIIPTTAALVPYTYPKFSTLSGLSLVASLKTAKYEITEDVLFTHKGLSGPAVLKNSLHWTSGQRVQVNWLPGKNIEDILKAKTKQNLKNVLKEYLPMRFVDFLLNEAKVDGQKTLQELSIKTKNQLKELIHFYSFIPTGTEGYTKAEVTKGGVCTSKVCSKTMESKLQPGLYFIGEVLDVTGQLGGFNFQWAWASAHLAGTHLRD